MPLRPARSGLTPTGLSPSTRLLVVIRRVASAGRTGSSPSRSTPNGRPSGSNSLAISATPLSLAREYANQATRRIAYCSFVRPRLHASFENKNCGRSGDWRTSPFLPSYQTAEPVFALLPNGGFRRRGWRGLAAVAAHKNDVAQESPEHCGVTNTNKDRPLAQGC